MPRPIESLLSLPRLRLFDRVPILETEKLIRSHMNQTNNQPKLVKAALGVSEGSAIQFSNDDVGLSTLLNELNSADYIVTKRSRTVMEQMLSGICKDGSMFKEFEHQIEPLYELSRRLLQMSKFADALADKTKEESIDVARALMLNLPGDEN
jgi:hypothetical protein